MINGCSVLEPTDEIAQGKYARLFIFVIFSILLHSYLIFLPDLPEWDYTSLQVAQTEKLIVHLDPWHEPLPPGKDHKLELEPEVRPKAPITDLPESSPSLDKSKENTSPKSETSIHQLIYRSRAFARSQALEAPDKGSRFFYLPKYDHTLTEAPAGQDRAPDVETVKLAHGNSGIKLQTIFGTQCFEWVEADQLDEFSIGALLFTRCW